MGKVQLHSGKIIKIYAWKIKPFPLERTKRSLIYGNPKIPESIKINMKERRAYQFLSCKPPMRGTKTTGLSLEKSPL